MTNFHNLDKWEFRLHGQKRSGCCNVDENRIEQCLAAHIVHMQLSTILNNIVTPDSGYNIVQYC